MIKKILSCAKGFGATSLLSSLFVVLEAVLEVFIPFMMMKIVDVGIVNQDLPYVLKIGGLMILVSLASLTCGVLSGRFAAVSATGFARNIRNRLFACIQSFSFGNIDRLVVLTHIKNRNFLFLTVNL